MKKTRVLILLLAVLLMFTCVLFVACNDDDEGADCSEGHTWKNANNPKRQKLIQSRTCTLPEIRERECKVCKTTEQYESLLPTGHIYDTTKKIDLNDATCTENGHTVNHCYWYESCGYKADLIEEIPNSATGHTFLNYVPSVADPTIGVAKCTDCDETDELLLGFDLDMEGDRAHIGYQALGIYTANVADGYEFATVGENTYLAFNRPADGYIGGSEFGVTLAPNKFMVDSQMYVIEVTLMLDGANNDIVIVGKKALKGQQMEFIRYIAADKTIAGATGELYELDNEDLANGVNIAVVVNDKAQWYQVYINNDLVSGTIAFVDDYFVGFELATIDIVSLGTDATVFGIDNLKLHEGDEPEGYEGGTNLAYTTEDLGNGEKVSIKKPDADCTHAYAPKKVVAVTCTTYGYTVEACSVCEGQRITDKVAPPEDHPWAATVETVDPTCLETGYEISTCTACDVKKVDKTLDATGHTHGIDATVIAATCKADKVTKGDCEICGTYFEETDFGTKLVHKLGDNVTVTLPTCSDDGFTGGPCVHCGINFIDKTTTVPAYGHYYFELDEHKDATCNSGGYDKYTCPSCNKVITDNEVPNTGHKLYTKVDDTGTTKTVYTYCVKCSYGYAYTESLSKPTYSQISQSQTVSLLQHFYDGNNTLPLEADKGDPYVDLGSGKRWRNGAWFNMNDNAFGRFVAEGNSDTINGDTYMNFPAASQNKANTNQVWEFDVKYPDAGTAYKDGVEYGQGAVSIGYSCDTNEATAAGVGVIKIYPDGSIVMNRMDGDFKTNGTFSSNVYNDKINKSMDMQIAPAGTVNRTTWTKISIVLNYTERTTTVYVNGVGTTRNLPDYFAAKQRYIRFNFMHTADTLSAMDLSNMYYYIGTMPTYLKAPSAPADVMNTSFSKDFEGADVPSGGLTGVTALSGSLNMTVNNGLNVGLKSNQLTYVTASAEAGSKIYGDVTAYVGKIFTTRTETNVATALGDYGLVGLSCDGKSLPIVYIKDGKLQITGSDYKLPISAGAKLNVDVVVNDNKKTYDVYINGVLAAVGISYDKTEFAEATVPPKPEGDNPVVQPTIYVEYYNINEGCGDISLTVSQIKVFVEEVVPDYYVGVTQSYDSPGYKDLAVSFTGDEKLGALLPVNTKIPGGYYYTEILGQSYLSLAVTPATEKIAGNVRYTKIDGKGVVDVEEGFNAIAVDSFKTNGVYNLKLDNLFGIKSTDTGYDISGYTKMITSFFVDDLTAGYTFKIVLYKGSVEYEVFKGSKTTGWYVLECDISATTFPDEIDAIGIVFDGEGCGVDGDTDTDEFAFALKDIYFATDGAPIPGTNYVFKPHSQCKNKDGSFTHTYNATVTTVDAKCDSHGYTIKTCDKCGYLDVQIIERKGHKYTKAVEGNAVAADCENAGYQYYACNCGAKSKEIINKLEHNFVLDENATEQDGKKAATCTENGIDIYICTNSNCNHGDKKFGMVTEALGHTPAEGATSSVTTPVSCELDGTTRVSKCANCDQAYDVTVKATNHRYKEVVVPATCTEDGEYYKICTNAHCDDKGGKVIGYTILDRTGHSVPAQYLLTRVEVSCTNPSGWQYDCLTCGETDILVDDGATARPHTWGEWEPVTPESCGTDGFRDKTCAECSGKLSEIGTKEQKKECVILANGEHDWADEWTYSEDYVAGVRGEKWYDCSVCDATKGAFDGIVKEGAGTEGLVFTYNNIDAYVITGYNGSATEIVVPAIFNGKPVVIGTNAFAGNTSVTSISIADGVLLSNGVFAGCTALESVKLPTDITAIPTNAFSGCTVLNSIELPASCTEIGMGAFADCTALKSITINGTLTSVKVMAFANCTSLAEVKYVTDKIPYIVIESVGNNAFLAENIWSAIA